MGSSLDDIAPAFGAACDRWPEAQNLQQHYRDLVRTYEEEGASLIELTKSFLEAVCWTVVNELGVAPPDTSTPSTAELLSRVLDVLGLRNRRGVGPLGKVISAHNKLAEGLNELRKDDGSVAHGKDGFLDAISSRHVRVYLLSADAVIALILSAYDGREPNLLTTREPVGRFHHLNARIDAGCALDAEVDLEESVLVVRVLAGERVATEAIELRVPPSELLYQLDRQAYVSVLEALRDKQGTGGEDTSDTLLEAGMKAAEVAAAERRKTSQERGFLAEGKEVVDVYEGWYRDKVRGLEDYVIQKLLNGNTSRAQDVRRFANTLLAAMERLAVVDWGKRPSARSRVRMYVKRLIRRVGLADGIGEGAEKIVEWLSREIPGGEEG